MTPFLAEVIGTFFLMLFGNGVVANVSLKKTYGHQGGWLLINFGWGMAVFTAVFIAGSISGAHINPAVTIGLAAAGKFPWAEVPMYILAQMIGAFLGAAVTYVHYRDHFKASLAEGEEVLGIFATGPAIPNRWINLSSEVIGTFVLVFAIFFLVNGEGLGSLSALPVGLLVFAIGMSLGGTTGYAINPARDLSPRIFHALAIRKPSNWRYAWVPVVGPLAGGLLAAGLYTFLQTQG